MYPITIVKDRYGGTYSGGAFLAFNLSCEEIPLEIDADDVTCCKFWKNTKIKVGKGATPDEALDDLYPDWLGDEIL